MGKKTETTNDLIAPAPTVDINGALLDAQRALTSVGKDAQNSFHRYSYTSSEGMLSACRDALHRAGLVVRRTHWTIDPSISEFGVIRSTFVVAHPASGGTISDETMWPIVPEKGRPFDKAVAGALTSSLNYFLRDLLQVPREEETMDSRDDRNYEPKRRTFSPSDARGGEQPKERPAPAPVPQRKQESAAAGNGEWVEITVKYVDTGVAGKNQSPYVKLKDSNGDSWMVWDEALFGNAKASRGTTIYAITEPSRAPNGMPRIVQLRTNPPAAPTFSDDIPV